MRAIRCVSGESSKCGSALTLMNDLSRRCPTHGSPLPRRGTSFVCVCMGARGTEVIFACVLVGCVFTAECVLFWHPLVTHVNGMAAALHESVIWGQGVSEMAGIKGLNTVTPHTTLRGHPTILMGKSMIRFPF